MTTAAKPRILEKHIQETVVEFLQLDGWRAFRTELTVQRERGRVVGERGQPDYLLIRYRCEVTDPRHGHERRIVRPPAAQILWIEFKRPGQKPKPDQNLWHATETARGALVMVVDDIYKFKDWYLASGLNRRIAA